MRSDRRLRAANDNGGLAGRLKSAVPPLRLTLLAALAWGAAMALSAQATLWVAIAAETAHFWSVSLLCLAGGAIAFPPALFLVRLSAMGRPPEVWFAAAILFLSAVTVAVTAAIYALVYREFYAQWHGPAFSRIWFYQFVFTTLSALYQFAVLGLRLYLPLGAFVLLATAYVIARRHSPPPPKARFSTI